MTVDEAVERVVRGPEQRLRLVGGVRGSAPAGEAAETAELRRGAQAPVREAAQAPALSAREKEVLLAWYRSDSKATAAAELFISVGTLNTHLARVRTKYARVGRAASTKAALVVRALQDGL